LREEGSDEKGPNEGRGYYKQVEHLNDDIIAKARKDITKYKDDAESNKKDFEQKLKDYLRDVRTNPSLEEPKMQDLGPAPTVPDPEKVSDNLSNYVDFLHPWGHGLLNPIVLLIMFFGLIIATIVALRAQDIG
jgi:hypothetical protein